MVSRALASILALAIAIPALAQAPAAAEEVDPTLPPTIYSWPNFTCFQLGACPAGAQKDPARPGDYLNCIAAGAACTGTCNWCAGSTTPGSACKPPNGDTCYLGNLFGTFTCGASAGTACTWAATPPAGEPYPTPSRCYCPAFVGTPTGKACTMMNCV